MAHLDLDYLQRLFDAFFEVGALPAGGAAEQKQRAKQRDPNSLHPKISFYPGPCARISLRQYSTETERKQAGALRNIHTSSPFAGLPAVPRLSALGLTSAA